MNLWITELYQCITNSANINNTSVNSGFGLTAISEPRGVLAIELTETPYSSNIKLVLSALCLGNSLLLLHDGKPAQNLYLELSKKFPSGVVNIVPYNLSNIKTISTHKDVSVYFGNAPTNPIFSFLSIQDSRLFTFVDDSFRVEFGKTTSFVKNIWSDIGKSSNCNLGG